MELNSQVYVTPSVVRKGENWRLISVYSIHPGRGVCVSDGVRALLPDSCRGVAGEGQ